MITDQKRVKFLKELQEKEVKFQREFESNGFIRKKIEGDGNCLYRGVCMLYH